MITYCKVDDSPNLPGWTEYSKRYTSWRPLELPCGGSASIAANSSKVIAEEIYEVEIFPNPNNGLFNIRTDMEMFNVEIMNAEGKTVYRMDRVTDQFMEISLDNMTNGMYLVRLISDDAVITKRVTIQR